MAAEYNLQALIVLYNRQVNTLKKRTENVYWTILVMLFTNLITFVLTVPIVMAMAADQMGGIVIALLCLIIPAIGTYIYLSSKSELKKKIRQTIEDCRSLARDEYNNLYKVCDDILVEMELPGTPYQILYLANNQYFPGILESQGISYLIITRNFLKLIYKKPEQAQALIFHEFAHIRQGDSNNYLFNSILADKAMMLGVIMLGTILLGIVFRQFMVSTVSIVGILSYYTLRSSRLDSEVLADLNAVIHNKGNDLISVLQDYAVKDPAERATHLPPTDRIKRIQYVISTYNLSPAAHETQISEST